MRGTELIADFGERLILLLLFGAFVASMAKGFSAHHLTVLLVISESLAVFLILIRKPGAIVVKPYPMAVAIIGTAMPLLVRMGDTVLLPAIVTGTIMGLGLCVNIAAKLALNRSFGIVAANRGVKRGGPYRLVRHPMYLGYFLTQLGFLASAFSWTNLGIYLVAWTAQILRIFEEEKFLSLDPEYREFMRQVRWRVLPGF